MKMVDTISNLPDELLCHILSFLPTKFAFTTTLLSKRWSSLIYSTQVIRFDELFLVNDTFRRFCCFVDKIMLSPLSTNQPLKTFSLSCDFRGNGNGNKDFFNLTAWLEAAKRRRVEELHISTPFNFPFQTFLKSNIFISQTLVVLKLTRIHITSDTSCVDLPSVKTLHLNSVDFDNWNDYIIFLSACPNLHDLHDQSNKKDIAPEEKLFKSLSLSKLVSGSIRSRDVMFNVVKNVEFLNIISLYPKEDSFKVIPVFQNLIHIELELVYSFIPSFHCWDDVVKLLRHCPKLQILSIKKWTDPSSSKEWKCPISDLECVSSHLRLCTIENYDGSADDLLFAAYILQNACFLQDMKIGVTTDKMVSPKKQIIEELSSYSMISLECKLSFEFKDSYYLSGSSSTN